MLIFRLNKIQSLKERFNILERPSLEVIRNPNHMEITLKTARAGTVLLKRDPEVLPFRSDHSRFYYLYEFVSLSGTEKQEHDNMTLFATLLNEKLINFNNICLDSNNPTDKSLAYSHETITDKIVIVATRNAHLNPKQLKKAKELINSTERSVLICLRNPYDAGILIEAKTVLCTCGDSIPSIKAAIEVLTGQFTPTAKLPVPLTMK